MKNYRTSSLFLSSLVFIALLLPLPSHATEEPELVIAAKHAILVDATHGEILFEQSAHDKAYPASTTKIMTALIVLDAVDDGTITLDQMVTCPPEALEGLSIYGSTQNIKAGETMSVQDLLYCLMLPSANEAGNILAYAVSGDIPSFVQQMNNRSKELGTTNTNFVNTSGLHDDNHYTTAYDLSLIFEEAMNNDTFYDIVSTALYTTAATEYTAPRELINTNGLISRWYYDSYFYKNAVGGKTGTTPEAGTCLVTLSEQGDEVLISVILGSQSLKKPDGTIRERQNFTETVRLTEWGFDNFERVTLSSEDTPVASIPVTLSQEVDEILVRPVGSISRTLPVSLDLENLDEEIVFFENPVQAPITEGQVLGTLTISHQGTEYGTLDLVALRDVELSQFLYYKNQVEVFFSTWGTELMLGSVSSAALLITLRILFVRKKRNSRSYSAHGGRGRSRR